MTYKQQFQQIKDLGFDTELPILTYGGTELFVLRPSKLARQFSNYDVNKNFQIWLRSKEIRPFKPNHLRVFIDLYLRTLSRPDLRASLAKAFDDIFYGADPQEAILSLKNEVFEHSMMPLEITAELSQLFIIEQNHGYNKESRYDPPAMFFQGWVRQVIDASRDIDNILMSAARRQPAASRYTDQENPKNKKFTTDLKPQWWLAQ